MKNIAILAHDKMKPKMVEFLNLHKDWIPGVNMLATGRTAEYVEKHGIDVKHLSPGESGGYNQIEEMIARKEVDIVIFFRDPSVNDHHEDIKNLMFACNSSDIPFATNYASAKLLILGLIKMEATERRKSN
ncbi:MAG: methylglyoxal synthase [Bacteroidota bacterium]|nr:methylglyoxal synthase [Bacteroidota bacterium]